MLKKMEEYGLENSFIIIYAATEKNWKMSIFSALSHLCLSY